MAAFKPFPSIAHVSKHSEWEINEENHKFYIQEKVDGSQLTVVVIDGILCFFNKNSQVYKSNKVFGKTINMLQEYFSHVKLNDKYIYHGEAISSIQHNCVIYDRIPRYGWIIYDIYDKETEKYLNYEQIELEAKRINIETVQLLYVNHDPTVNPYEKAQELIEKIEKSEITSCLGGRIEGIVIKHPNYFDGKKYVARKQKMVTSEFKEQIHTSHQKRTTETTDDFIKRIGSQFNTHARFQKAIQHFMEKNDGRKPTKKDMGKLINELDEDFDKEYQMELMIMFYAYFANTLHQSARTGFAEWFKDQQSN